MARFSSIFEASQCNTLSEQAKILIIRFSSIGDVVLTTPIIRCLKNQVYGGAEIHYLIRKPFAPVLENNPYIDKLHVLGDDNREELLEELKEENFHYVVDLHKNIRSLYFKSKLKVLSFSFPKLNIQKWLLVNFGINRLPDVHIVDRYFEAVKALNVKNDGEGLDYFIAGKDQFDLNSLEGYSKNEYVAFAIGGAHEGKKLPMHKMVDLCTMIKRPIILIGGKEDMENATIIAKAGDHVYSLCGKLSINQSASVLEQSRLVITHDSGMMHIASAFKKKIISIWGATVPAFGMYAYLPDPASVIIEADHLTFRPTSKLGNKKSKKEKRTTEEIDLNRIKDAVIELWD